MAMTLMLLVSLRDLRKALVDPTGKSGNPKFRTIPNLWLRGYLRQGVLVSSCFIGIHVTSLLSHTDVYPFVAGLGLMPWIGQGSFNSKISKELVIQQKCFYRVSCGGDESCLDL